MFFFFFLILSETKFIFYVTFIMSFAKPFNSDQPKILSFGKELTFNISSVKLSFTSEICQKDHTFSEKQSNEMSLKLFRLQFDLLHSKLSSTKTRIALRIKVITLWLPAFSPFPTMFSIGFYLGVISRECVVKSQTTFTVLFSRFFHGLFRKI